jgi:hypothetical protein
VAQNIKRLKDIGCYRGRRHIMVGSCRGRSSCTADSFESGLGPLGWRAEPELRGESSHVCPANTRQMWSAGIHALGSPGVQHAARYRLTPGPGVLPCVPAGPARARPADKDQRPYPQGQGQDGGSGPRAAQSARPTCACCMVLRTSRGGSPPDPLTGQSTCAAAVSMPAATLLAVRPLTHCQSCLIAVQVANKKKAVR